MVWDPRQQKQSSTAHLRFHDCLSDLSRGILAITEILWPPSLIGDGDLATVI